MRYPIIRERLSLYKNELEFVEEMMRQGKYDEYILIKEEAKNIED